MKKVPAPAWASEVKALREGLGLTQDEFAVRVGVAGSTVGYWEAGKVAPHKRTRERIRALSAAQSSEAPARKNRRYSDETIAVLHQALDIILDHAPSEVMQTVSESLTKFAGQWGEREAPAAEVLVVSGKVLKEISGLTQQRGLDTSAILRDALSLGLDALSRSAAAQRQVKINKEAHRRAHPKSA